MVASTTPAANSDTSKDDDNGRSSTITASTALETGRQVVASVQSLQGYNHVQPMLPLENHQQPQPQHEQQQQQPQPAHEQQQANAHSQSDMIENAHVTPVPSPHQGHQPANDTAFPGGQLRHNYSIHQQQQHHQSHLLSALSHPGAKQAKQIQKNTQVSTTITLLLPPNLTLPSPRVLVFHELFV